MLTRTVRSTHQYLRRCGRIPAAFHSDNWHHQNRDWLPDQQEGECDGQNHCVKTTSTTKWLHHFNGEIFFERHLLTHPMRATRDRTYFDEWHKPSGNVPRLSGSRSVKCGGNCCCELPSANKQASTSHQQCKRREERPTDVITWKELAPRPTRVMIPSRTSLA